jgi:uncharacterized protein (DUF1800 family)
MRSLNSASRPDSAAEATGVESHQPADQHEVGEARDRSSRRSFVFFGALAATALLPGKARAQAVGRTRQRKPFERDVPPPDGFLTVPQNEGVAAFKEWDAATTSRLVRRVTLGVTPADVAKATQLGWQGYLNYQLNYARINDDAVEAAIAQKWPLMSQTSEQLFAADGGQVQTQLRESTLYRAAFSQRQLYQRMVEFWTDHFNQDIDKVGYVYVADLRDVIRKNALGYFPDLLRASAHSASMMAYLDQNASRKGAPNQNYAREIMELHTLGVDGGYTQDDVAELSRVLTGWTIQGKGQFVFNATIHDTGTKTVMGQTIAGVAGAAGISEGEQMLDFLVSHPSTARFIATKMLKWLLDPNPTEAQISTVASAYKATHGDIKAMIRVILNDTWLPAAPMKLKRPFHFVASALRSTNPTVTTISPVSNQLTTLGQQLFSWDTPDGYPDKMEYWAGNIVPRWSFGTTMSNQNSTTAVQVDTTPYRAGSTAAAIDLLDQNFFGGEMPLVTRNALLAYAGTAALTDAKARELIALSIGANAFQWY